jgi:putative inorganic carbon (HCO3(-)) transporter
MEQVRHGADWIVRNEFWLVPVYALPLLFASNIPSWLFLGALVTVPFFWLARRITRGTWSVATPLDLPLALLLALGLVGVAVSSAPPSSFLLYCQFLGGTALFYGIVNGLAPARISWGAWALLALGAGFGLVGLLGLQSVNKFLPLPLLSELLPRLELSFLNPRGFTPNIVAGAVLPIAALAFGWGWMQARGRRIAILTLAMLLTAVLFLTQSRGALIGLGAGLTVLVLWRVPRFGWLFVMGGLALVAFTVFAREQALGAILAGDATGSVESRFEVWSRALYILRDFPFTGIGIGAFEQVVHLLYPLFLNDPSVPLPHAHNLYLQMGVDFGVGGFVAFVALMTTALGVGIGNVRREGRASSAGLAVGVLAGLVAFLVHGFLDAAFLSTKVSVGVWSLLGLMMLFPRAHE